MGVHGRRGLCSGEQSAQSYIIGAQTWLVLGVEIKRHQQLRSRARRGCPHRKRPSRLLRHRRAQCTQGRQRRAEEGGECCGDPRSCMRSRGKHQDEHQGVARVRPKAESRLQVRPRSSLVVHEDSRSVAPFETGKTRFSFKDRQNLVLKLSCRLFRSQRGEGPPQSKTLEPLDLSVVCLCDEIHARMLEASSSPLGIDDDQEAGAPDAGPGPSSDARQYRTPESLATMEACDFQKLEQDIYGALVQVREDWDSCSAHDRVHFEHFDLQPGVELTA